MRLKSLLSALCLTVLAACGPMARTARQEDLGDVVSHALAHDGYVGGWWNSEDSLYYFDSVRILPGTPGFYRYDNVRLTCDRYGVPVFGSIDEAVEALP